MWIVFNIIGKLLILFTIQLNNNSITSTKSRTYFDIRTFLLWRFDFDKDVNQK